MLLGLPVNERCCEYDSGDIMREKKKEVVQEILQKTIDYLVKTCLPPREKETGRIER